MNHHYQMRCLVALLILAAISYLVISAITLLIIQTL